MSEKLSNSDQENINQTSAWDNLAEPDEEFDEERMEEPEDIDRESKIAEEVDSAGRFLTKMFSHYEYDTQNLAEHPEDQDAASHLEKSTNTLEVSQDLFGEITDPENDRTADEILEQLSDKYSRLSEQYRKLGLQDMASTFSARADAAKNTIPEDFHKYTDEPETPSAPSDTVAFVSKLVE